MAIVFKDLQKLVSKSQQENRSKELFERLQDKPFWILDKQQHKLEDIRTDGDCCFNHIIGLPTKEPEEKAIFDYEKIVYYALLDNDDSIHAFKHKHLRVKKATGLGVFGLGRIGSAVARRAKGFNMHIIYHTRHGRNTWRKIC